MSRIVLIHGFATGVRYSVFRDAHGADAGFKAFRELVEQGDATAFRWDIQETASFWQTINPLYILGVYRRERALASHPETHEALARFFADESPEIVICHSLGACLLLEHIRRHGLPDSVRRIVFTQADAHPREFAFCEALEERLRNGSLTMINAHCPWDPSLWCSLVLNGARAGLAGARHPLVRDVFWPLVKPINLHTSAIRSPGFPKVCV